MLLPEVSENTFIPIYIMSFFYEYPTILRICPNKLHQHVWRKLSGNSAFATLYQ